MGEVAKKIGNNRAANDAAHKSSIHAFDELSSRRSAELVISLCGPVGSGVSFVKETLFTELEARSYKVLHIKVSDLIDKKALAFSDNVQDAAHRAGFFNSRTWRFGLRSSIQRYAQNGGNG